MNAVSANWSDQARAESLRVRRMLAEQRREAAARSRENRARNEAGSQAAHRAATRPDLASTSRNDMTNDEGHMLDRNNRLDEYNQIIEDAGIDALNDEEFAQYLDDMRDLIINGQSINDTEESVLDQIFFGELNIDLGEPYKGQDDPIPAWLEARSQAAETVQQLLDTDLESARQWAADYEADPDLAGPPPNGGDPNEFHQTLRSHFPARDNEGIIPSDPVESGQPAWRSAINEIKAKWTDAARAASQAARRAMGWPGPSQQWNRGSGQSAPAGEGSNDRPSGSDRPRREEVADDPHTQRNRDEWSQQPDESVEEYQERIQKMREEMRENPDRNQTMGETPGDNGQSGGHNQSDAEFIAAINEGGFSSDAIGNADESDIAAVIHQVSPEQQDDWFGAISNDPESLREAVQTVRQSLENGDPIDDYTGAFLDHLTRRGYAGENDGDPVFQEMERRAARMADEFVPPDEGWRAPAPGADSGGDGNPAFQDAEADTVRRQREEDRQQQLSDGDLDQAFRERLRQQGIDPNRREGESLNDYMNRLFPGDAPN